MTATNITGILEFLRQAERLKNTIRSGHTSEGRQESVAEHTWRLCLMAMVFSKEFPDVDFERLIKICIIHDLGEAIRGDIPAPAQVGIESKADQERADLLVLLAPLPESIREEIEELWDDYVYAQSPEARLAKALDKLETILQHNQGINPSNFDYRFNLEYGKKYTSYDPLIGAIRKILDQETGMHALSQESP